MWWASDTSESQLLIFKLYFCYLDAAKCTWRNLNPSSRQLVPQKMSYDKVDYSSLRHSSVRKGRQPSKQPFVLLVSKSHKATYVDSLNPKMVSTLQVPNSFTTQPNPFEIRSWRLCRNKFDAVLTCLHVSSNHPTHGGSFYHSTCINGTYSLFRLIHIGIWELSFI